MAERLPSLRFLSLPGFRVWISIQSAPKSIASQHPRFHRKFCQGSCEPKIKPRGKCCTHCCPIARVSLNLIGISSASGSYWSQPWLPHNQAGKFDVTILMRLRLIVQGNCRVLFFHRDNPEALPVCLWYSILRSTSSRTQQPRIRGGGTRNASRRSSARSTTQFFFSHFTEPILSRCLQRYQDH